MDKEVRGLPIVERFIAVGDWREEGREKSEGKEKEERDNEGWVGRGGACRHCG